jgi:hypothetical protein
MPGCQRLFVPVALVGLCAGPAFAHHGEVGLVLLPVGGDCEEVLARFARAGINIDTLAGQLQDEGAKPFVKSWDELLAGYCGARSPGGGVASPRPRSPRRGDLLADHRPNESPPVVSATVSRRRRRRG